MSKKVIYLFSFVALLVLTGSAWASLSSDPALVIYYSYDAPFEDVVPDDSGNGHDGVVEGDVTWEAEGMHDGAARFARGSYLDLDGPSFPAEVIPTTGITLAAWAQCENTGGDHAIFNARAGDSTWLVHPELRGSGNFRWLLRSAGGNTIFDIRAGSVDWEEWLHYAGTYDKAAGKAALYINGQAIQEQNINGAPDIAGDWDSGARVGYNIDNARPFTGLMDDFALFNRGLTGLEVQSLMLGLEKRGPAVDPVPEDEATDIPRDVVLNWTAGPYAETHDVYLGTVFDDVNSVDRANPVDLLVSEGQDATTHDPVGLLDFSQTYYWRIDEVNAAPDYTIYKGNVWSFTTEPFAYPIEDITATSNTASEANAGPEKTVDGSGLNELDEHSTRASDMWLGRPLGDETPWIQYEFDRVYKLHEIEVWNYNVEFELVLGFGVKDMTVEYSEDGATWATLGEVQLAQGTAKSDYTANTSIDFGGWAAKFVRFTINSGFGAIPQYGLSEVRFLYIPAQARYPEPADGATEVDVNAVLSWRAGREAASHEVYLSTDEAAVAGETALLDTTDTAGYATEALDLGTMYYWKINEVNEAEAIASWEGDVWRFMTQEYAVIDDFESYTEIEDERIYETWIDGWTNETGSVVGHLEAPFVEKKIVHGGKQSMPLEYNNAEAPFYSEASRTWTAAQDWTAGKADSLRLYFQGSETNEPETLYVAIEDSSGQAAVVSHADAQAVTGADWQEWVIPLSEFGGVDLTSVETVYLGFGNRDNATAGGKGQVFIDDIGYGRPAAAE